MDGNRVSLLKEEQKNEPHVRGRMTANLLKKAVWVDTPSLHSALGPGDLVPRSDITSRGFLTGIIIYNC